PLDLAPKLLPDLTKAMSPGGETEMVHVGSTAVRAALERYHPLLALHGHIHESRGVAKLGRTLCANPGSEYAGGVLRGFLADLEGDKVRSYILTSG
ncbi:MAG: metallophosphoesterase, partial [Nitrososphaerota archaeon]|nr:metallophosphoesterase [Nitrososphaerota archaeon]